ncbi:MAG: NUDIX hydrolase [SAR324 cluster bacterium]|uniref:NUDIX hydrolase n=1 Tax=SAR324 cluster bacterium TaxID=2024889 RepID=A0A2A4TB47_9DELT|nr:MAG: NUDIX hydrolase [SAR324 cluster bacterium]
MSALLTKQIIRVASVILLDERKVLLGLRKNTEAFDGYWAFVGGRVEPGESLQDALVREAWEEIGIRIDPGGLKEPVVHRERGKTMERTHFMFEVRHWQGDPVNREPELCAQVSWFSVDDLPQNMIPFCKEALKDY